MEISNSTLLSNLSHSVNVSGTFRPSPYTTVEMVVILLVAGSLSLVTATGNILVMLSIKVSSGCFCASLPGVSA